MSGRAQPPARLGPDWVVTEMPAGYQNRVAEIQRLAADLEAMTRFGRLLCEIGPPLSDAVLELITALKFEAALLPGPVPSVIGVKLDSRRRLLLYVSAIADPLDKKSPELGVGSITPDTAAFLARMGAGHVTAPTLFSLWKLSLQEPDRARAQLERLHAQDGGTFQLPAAIA